MLAFHVDEERCVLCGECALDCPAGIIVMDGYPRITDQEACLQCQHCLAVCPGAGISILGRDPEESTLLAGNLPEPAQVATLIKGRRSVRRYRERDLAPELIDELLNVACHAPTGVNARSVLFTVVREGAVLRRLRDHLMARLGQLKEAGELPAGLAGRYLGRIVNAWRSEGRDMLFRGAPHLLITSAPSDTPCPVQDTHIALATFQLIAYANGVGTVWDGLFMMALAVCPEVMDRLGIPDNHTIGYAMAFGEPAVEYHRTVQRGPAQVNVVRW